MEPVSEVPSLKTTQFVNRSPHFDGTPITPEKSAAVSVDWR